MQSDGSDRREVIPLSDDEQVREAQSIVRQEADALLRLADGLDSTFCAVIRSIRECSGRVIVTGVGKAGLIGQKVVATLASTGTAAFFLHPTEAVHGDLGCVRCGDVVVAFSNSGESDEVLRLVPSLRRIGVTLIAVTRDTQNSLSRLADISLPLGNHSEAGPLQLAPTSSTTAMLALGDAVAMVLSRLNGFSEHDFALFHPAGSLGAKLRPVHEVMRRGSQLRIADASETVRQVMIDHSCPGRRTGAVILTGCEGRIAGIFTDSDLARLFEQRREDQLDQPIREVMTVNPTTVRSHVLLPEVIQLMSDRKLSELPVIDDDRRPVGLVDITDVISMPVEPYAAAKNQPIRRTG
ncbi:MAG: KpsF/GutQ family sugar-phosphate isomerase [Planctomycetaceae bacterium]